MTAICYMIRGLWVSTAMPIKEWFVHFWFGGPLVLFPFHFYWDRDHSNISRYLRSVNLKMNFDSFPSWICWEVPRHNPFSSFGSSFEISICTLSANWRCCAFFVVARKQRNTCFPCFGVVQLALRCYGDKPCQHGSRHHDSSEQLRHAISCYTMLHIKKQGAMFGHEWKAKIGECNRICEWSSFYGFLFAGAAQHHLLNNNTLEAAPIFKTWACGTLQTGGTQPFES